MPHQRSTQAFATVHSAPRPPPAGVWAPFLFGSPGRVDAAFRSTRELGLILARNTGNLAPVHAVDAHLGGGLPTARWTAVDATACPGNVAVLPAAHQSASRWDFRKTKARLSGAAVVALGVGAGAQADRKWTGSTLPKSMVKWLRWMATRAPAGGPNLGVASALLSDMLRQNGLEGSAAVVGCPSHFINPTPSLGAEIARRLRAPERIAVVAGHHQWRNLRRLEASLGRLVTRTNGSYIGQGPLDMMRLARGEAKSMNTRALRRCRNHVCPDMALPEFIDWSVRHGNLFFDVPNWLEHYQRFDFVVGTRIHGIVLGLQAGVPSLCIVEDSVTAELCRTLQVPHVAAAAVREGVERDDLLSYFRFDAEKFDRSRRRLCRAYVAFLRGNGLQPANWLVELGEHDEGARGTCADGGCR